MTATTRETDPTVGNRRWAAEQVIRHHTTGSCRQCAEMMSACPMLVWAQEVLRRGSMDYPAVETTGSTF